LFIGHCHRILPLPSYEYTQRSILVNMEIVY
jgi:hypothetical protein